MVDNIQFATSGNEPPYQVVFSRFLPAGSPQTRWAVFTFVEGYEYGEEEEVNIGVAMKTDGSKEFYLTVLYFDIMDSIPQEVLDEYPIEIVDSGITNPVIDGEYLDGWIDLLVFGNTYRLEIEYIKFTKGY